MPMRIQHIFSEAADTSALARGKPEAFLAAIVSTAGWAAAGPLFGWSDAWQLVANTVTNVVTFLMVFVIQNSQNRDSAAIQAKLDEILRITSPHSQLTGIENLTQEEIEKIKKPERFMAARQRTVRRDGLTVSA
jgi:low affinity Fe/Cu permease